MAYFDLTGQTAIVTGAAGGIGETIARRLATAGATVVVADLNLAAGEIVAASLPNASFALSLDVTSSESCNQLAAAVIARTGRIDIVVNNAGQSRTGPFESITDQIWQDDIDLKLFAAIRLARLAWPQMKERRWGRVINVLNTGAKAPKANGAPTHVTRAAGMALTKVLAGEGAPHNILVNAMLVGLIVTDQVARGHAALVAKGQNITLEQHIANTGAPIPLGRMGTAEEFANLACFLASDAGSYITGTATNVDGGASPVV